MGRVPLRAGETSIDTVRPYQVTIKGRLYVRIGWSIRLPGEVVSRTYYTTARLGTELPELRRRAHERAGHLLYDASSLYHVQTGWWSVHSPIADYLREVTAQAVEDEPGIRPRSRARYRRLLAIALEEADDQSIAQFCVPRSLIGFLRRVATTHGTATAQQLKRWMGKYVMRQLVMDAVISRDPLRDLEVRLPSVSGDSTCRATAVLTPEQRAQVIEYLLGGASPPPYRGPLTAEQAAAFRTTIVDMTLVHATCGLRANECRCLLARDVDLAGPVPVIEVTPEISKTHRGRKVPLFDPVWGEAVGRRLAVRVDAKNPNRPVFGAARDAGKLIEPRRLSSNTRKLYDELADTLGIPLLREVGTHVWRATLNTEWQAKGMPAALCSALFGHSVAVNHSYYTATFDPELICRAASQAAAGIR